MEDISTFGLMINRPKNRVQIQILLTLAKLYKKFILERFTMDYWVLFYLVKYYFGDIT